MNYTKCIQIYFIDNIKNVSNNDIGSFINLDENKINQIDNYLTYNMFDKIQYKNKIYQYENTYKNMYNNKIEYKHKQNIISFTYNNILYNYLLLYIYEITQFPNIYKYHSINNYNMIEYKYNHNKTFIFLDSEIRNFLKTLDLTIYIYQNEEKQYNKLMIQLNVNNYIYDTQTITDEYVDKILGVLNKINDIFINHIKNIIDN